jgi:class 3 adenylate cyclase
MHTAPYGGESTNLVARRAIGDDALGQCSAGTTRGSPLARCRARGEVIRTTGDGFFIAFDSPLDAPRPQSRFGGFGVDAPLRGGY